MERQRAEILNRDLLEERERGRDRDKYQKDIPEDRGENLYTDLSKERERERGREEKSKSRDLSNRSLKTDGETESGEPT